MDLEKTYVPIDTDLVDDLEHYALDKIRVRISYEDESGTVKELNGLIGVVYTREHAEYLRMTDGRTLRLDQLREVVPHQKV